MVPWAHPNPQPKRHLDPFNHFCTAYGTDSLYFTMGRPLPSNCPFPSIWSESNTWFLGRIRVYNPNSISNGSAAFAQLSAYCRYTLQWAAPLPQNCPFPSGSGPHLIHGSLGSPDSSTQMAYWSVEPFLQGSLLWQTDRPRYRFGNNRPHLHM